MKNIIVVGASVAGIHAAECLRREGYDGPISLVDEQNDLPYDRPPLSKAALLPGFARNDSLLRSPSWYEEQGVELLLGRSATQLDLHARSISLSDGTDLTFGGLVLATGSAARKLDPTVDSAAALPLRSWNDCQRLGQRLVRGSSLVIIGGGFIGLEVAAAACQLGVKVSIIEAGAMPLAQVLGEEVGSWFKRLHEEQGVSFYCKDSVSKIDKFESQTIVQLQSGKTITADTVAIGIGASPVVGWLATSGLDLDNGVRCDSFLRTSAPNVVAAGDIACWYNPLYQEYGRVEHWTNAVEQGVFSARSLLGIDQTPFIGPPYFWSDQHTAKVRFIGRTRGASVRLQHSGHESLVAEYWKDDSLIGAVCINEPRKLIAYRRILMEQVVGRSVSNSF